MIHGHVPPYKSVNVTNCSLENCPICPRQDRSNLEEEIKQEGLKDDTAKYSIDRLSMSALNGINRAHQYGDEKYVRQGGQPGNWRLGIDQTKLCQAVIRHAMAILDGEMVDSESGLPHAFHIGANGHMLSHYWANEVQYKKFLVAAPRPELDK